MYCLLSLPPRNVINSQFLDFFQTKTIRGIAILMVVLMHSSCDLGMRAFTPFGGIGVALFLILSGYGLTESNNIEHNETKRKGVINTGVIR